MVGADVQAEKVAAFNAGESPIIEPELGELLAAGSRDGLLRATTEAKEAVASTAVSIVCVGTPSLESGRLNLDYVRKVSSQISGALRESGKRHTVIFRSTMLPGSTRTIVDEFFADLVASGQVAVFFCPEFLREGTAVFDFRNPSLSVIGTTDGKPAAEMEVAEILGAEPRVLRWEGAELIKYACNYFHALKVGFANEIGRLGKFVGVDAAEVMDVVCADKKLNISSYYMKPGNPFGGSCLPKDVSALSSFARQEGVSLPVLDSVLPTNQVHLDALLKQITNKETKKVGILGLAFKSDTDDLRGSPMVEVAETLLGRGYDVRIYDPQLNLSRLIGSNERLINRRMPHLAQLLKRSAAEVVGESDLVVVSQRCLPLEELSQMARRDQTVIDVNGWRELESIDWNYEGFCW